MHQECPCYRLRGYGANSQRPENHELQSPSDAASDRRKSLRHIVLKPLLMLIPQMLLTVLYQLIRPLLRHALLPSNIPLDTRDLEQEANNLCLERQMPRLLLI